VFELVNDGSLHPSFSEARSAAKNLCETLLAGPALFVVSVVDPDGEEVFHFERIPKALTAVA
jgi:hypothetical protein